MKGIKPQDEKKILKRRSFLTNLFLEDCKTRARHGFVDPPLSEPKVQKLCAKELGAQVNSQAIYNIRNQIFDQYGLDKKGRPKRGVAAKKHEGLLMEANRVEPANETPPLQVAVIGTNDESYGAFLKDAIWRLQEQGMVDPKIKVDAITRHYATVSGLE